MPSGRTHDRITIWTLPLITGVTFSVTQQAGWTLWVAIGYLFGGLMFGPDLDIHSVQYKRWGWLRWIWLPYRASMRHRSPLSHGPVVGTTLRVLYVALWAGIFLIIGVAMLHELGIDHISAAIVHDRLNDSWRRYPRDWISLLVGIELGALSHGLSDWTGSRYKRLRRQARGGTTAKSTPRRSRHSRPKR